MDGQTKPPEFQLAFHRPSRVSNYSYPHHSMSDNGFRRESLGSDCSMPGMIEDHGSDISTEDDYQNHATGSELWDSSWPARAHEGAVKRFRHGAIFDPQSLHHQQPLMTSHEVHQTVRFRTGSQTSEASEGSQQESPWPLPLSTSSSPKRRINAPPRASYSLFPPTTDFQPIQPPVPPRRPSTPGESNERRKADIIATPGNLDPPAQIASFVKRSLPATPSPKASRTKSSAASPTTRQTQSPSYMKPLPKTPDQRRQSTRHTSIANVRKRSLSRTPTQSTPLLSAHRQTIIPLDKKLQCRKSQIFRVSSPLLPKEPERRPPSPPHVSVFEIDSESDDDDAGTNTDEFRGLARRLVRGLGYHSHHHNRDRNANKETTTANHQRSASDSQSTTPTSNSTNPMAKSTRPQRRDRAVTTGAVNLGGAGSKRMGMDETSDVSPLVSGANNTRPVLKESRSRPWLSRQSSELFFGRILGRKGS